MGIESPRRSEAQYEVKKVHVGPNMPLAEQMTLQAVLMLRRYARIHKDVQGIDFTHPRKNSSDIQSAAMGEWVGGLGSKDVRGRYRAFIDRINHDAVDLGDIDLSDEQACVNLLAQIEGEKGPDAATDTIH